MSQTERAVKFDFLFELIGASEYFFFLLLVQSLLYIHRIALLRICVDEFFHIPNE